MYINIYIILIILLYQCLTICSFRFGMDKDQSEISNKPGLNDCILPIPGKNDLKKPVPYISISKPFSPFTPNSENMTIKHNSYFKLTCASGKFKSFIEENSTEITVKCLEGHLLKYKQYAYEYDYFECDDTQRLRAARKAFRKIFIPKTRKTPLINKNDCVLRMRDAHYKLPVIFTYNTSVSTMFHPDKRGNIVIRHNVTFKMSCPGSRMAYPTRYAYEVLVRCLNTSFIEYKLKTFEIKKCRCTQIPRPTMRITKHTCQHMNNKVFDVGFKTKTDFVVVYKICYDPININNVYSWYTVITPLYNKRQKPKRKLKFPKSTLFNSFNITPLYESQIKTVYEVVKSKKLAKLILKEEKGEFHQTIRQIKPSLLLTPSEFVYISEQRTAYFYENTAPLWYEYKHGIWNDLEVLFRRSMTKNIYKHVIITGTYGTCMLPDKNDTLRPLYLYLPKKSVTVPEYVWRMDYNLDRMAGIVFIILNNPYKKVDLNAYMCKVIPCPGGLKRTTLHSLKGFLFCCSKAGFEEVYGRIDPIVYWDYTQKSEPDQFTGIL